MTRKQRSNINHEGFSAENGHIHAESHQSTGLSTILRFSHAESHDPTHRRRIYHIDALSKWLFSNDSTLRKIT